jgi:hypothetical protein
VEVPDAVNLDLGQGQPTMAVNVSPAGTVSVTVTVPLVEDAVAAFDTRIM